VRLEGVSSSAFFFILRGAPNDSLDVPDFRGVEFSEFWCSERAAEVAGPTGITMASATFAAGNGDVVFADASIVDATSLLICPFT
jgi:hypothetical protein